MHELDAADQICPQCGKPLREMVGQTEDGEEITVVERRFVLVTHRRKKYRCACNGCGAEIADIPVHIVPGERRYVPPSLKSSARRSSEPFGVRCQRRHRREYCPRRPIGNRCNTDGGFRKPCRPGRPEVVLCAAQPPARSRSRPATISA